MTIKQKRQLGKPARNKLKLGESIVKVDWEDAWSNQMTNYPIENLQKETPKLLISVGFLCRNDKMGMTLSLEKDCGENGGKDTYRHVQHIPRSNVRSIVVLKH